MEFLCIVYFDITRLKHVELRKVATWISIWTHSKHRFICSRERDNKKHNINKQTNDVLWAFCECLFLWPLTIGEWLICRLIYAKHDRKQPNDTCTMQKMKSIVHIIILLLRHLKIHSMQKWQKKRMCERDRKREKKTDKWLVFAGFFFVFGSIGRKTKLPKPFNGENLKRTVLNGISHSTYHADKMENASFHITSHQNQFTTVNLCLFFHWVLLFRSACVSFRHHLFHISLSCRCYFYLCINFCFVALHLCTLRFSVV